MKRITVDWNDVQEKILNDLDEYAALEGITRSAAIRMLLKKALETELAKEMK